MDFLYKFVVSPGAIDPTLFGFINLSQPNFIIAFLNGVLQFIQIKMIGPKKIKKQGASFSDELQKQMQYFMPVFIVLILFRLPSALGLYFLAGSLFTIIQQYVILRKKNDEPGQFTTNKNNN